MSTCFSENYCLQTGFYTKSISALVHVLYLCPKLPLFLAEIHYRATNYLFSYKIIGRQV